LSSDVIIPPPHGATIAALVSHIAGQAPFIAHHIGFSQERKQAARVVPALTAEGEVMEPAEQQIIKAKQRVSRRVQHAADDGEDGRRERQSSERREGENISGRCFLCGGYTKLDLNFK
jgi:hypothetical protein